MRSSINRKHKKEPNRNFGTEEYNDCTKGFNKEFQQQTSMS